MDGLGGKKKSWEFSFEYLLFLYLFSATAKGYELDKKMLLRKKKAKELGAPDAIGKFFFSTPDTGLANNSRSVQGRQEAK